MKPFISHVAVLCALNLMSVPPAKAQSAALPASRLPSTPAVGQDAKEKAEDAELLQQLENDQKAAIETRPKGQRAPGAMRGLAGGGGGIGAVPAGVPYHVQNLLTRANPASRALVVRTGEADPTSQATLEEDLAIMSHIFDKALEDLPGGRGNANKIMGIDVFFTGSSPIRSLYLDNYGAVFFLSVNFPLIAPPERHVEEKPVGDSVWEDARQELYGQRLGGNGPGEPAEDYSQEKVDKLKDALFDALKNATNIRAMKPEEFVTIWVCGGNNAKTSRVRVFKNNQPADLGGNFMAAESAPARRTILTIRVSKSEIDAYAKGKLTLDAFQKRARVTAYNGDPSGPGPDGVAFGTYTGRVRF